MNKQVSSGYDLIVGASGQDGFYLQELLNSLGRKILCIDKDGFLDENKNLSSFDIRNATQVDALFIDYPIARIFYLPAYHHSAEQSDANHIDTLKLSMDIHVYALENFVEAIKKYRKTARLFYAASSHLFSGHIVKDARTQITIDEQTPLSPKGWYAISKTAGVELLRAARTDGVYAVNAFLFNHESALRPKSFLSSKLTHGALDAFLGDKTKLKIMDVNAQVDWGFAPDYVEAMHASLEHNTAQDYVIGSGKLHSVAQYAELVYGLLDLNWQDYTITDTDAIKKIGGGTALTGNSSRLFNATGWTPQTSFKDMVARILLEIARQRNIQIEDVIKEKQHAS